MLKSYTSLILILILMKCFMKNVHLTLFKLFIPCFCEEDLFAALLLFKDLAKKYSGVGQSAALFLSPKKLIVIISTSFYL